MSAVFAAVRRITMTPRTPSNVWLQPLSPEELARVNSFRYNRVDDAGRSAPPLMESPGCRYLVYGKDKDGYWTYVHFEDQIMAVLDVYETLYPDRQVVVEVDWSSGHAKLQVDGLNAQWMNSRIGGKQVIPKVTAGGTVITAGCVKEGGTLHNIRLGGKQHFRRLDEVYPGEAAKYATADIIDLAKGMGQILWERGFDTSHMNKGEMESTLSKTADFMAEKGMLEQRVTDRGHILLMSPKGHPELAGPGIEYSWGMAQRAFRKANNCVPKDLPR